MRTVATNVYSYFELSDEAKEKAYNDYCYTMDYPYHHEFEKVLDSLEGLIGMTVHNWEYDMYNFHFKLEIDDDEKAFMQGVQLSNYLLTNYLEYMEDTKELTGYFLDYCFFAKMKKMLQEVWENPSITFYQVINECIVGLFEGLCDDIQEFYSIGQFEELTEINEWEYLENGELY